MYTDVVGEEEAAVIKNSVIQQESRWDPGCDMVVRKEEVVTDPSEGLWETSALKLSWRIVSLDEEYWLLKKH